MKANRKQLKAILASKIRNFGPAPVVLKLVEFPLFDNFFPDLAKFWNLDIFLLFDFLDLDNFPDFLVYSILFLLTPNLLISLLLLFFLETDLLLLFLSEADLLPLFLLETGSSNDPVVFSIKINGAAILLKPWMNCQ